MGMSKTEAIKELERSVISNQQALVNKIAGTSENKILKYGIKHILSANQGKTEKSKYTAKTIFSNLFLLLHQLKSIF